MRYLLVLPLLTILSGAHPAPELVVSVGHAGAPTRAEFAGHYLATADGSNVALIDLVSGRTAAHLPQRSLVEAMVASPAGDLLAVGTCGHAVNLWDMKVDAGRAYVAADAAFMHYVQELERLSAAQRHSTERGTGVRIPPSPPTFAHACHGKRELRLASPAKVGARAFFFVPLDPASGRSPPTCRPPSPPARCPRPRGEADQQRCPASA